MPFWATSIIPLLKSVPSKMPKLATIKIVRMGATFEPTAEFKKFTASLLTPTTKSTHAKAKSR
jgi:hypothetical protein